MFAKFFILLQYKNNAELDFDKNMSVPLLYLGFTIIYFYLKNDKISTRHKILLLSLLTSSTLSDGFFLTNTVTLLDRYLGLIVVIYSAILVNNKEIKIFKKIYVKIILSIVCLYRARLSKSYNTWLNYHFMWHIGSFSVLRTLVKQGLYS